MYGCLYLDRCLQNDRFCCAKFVQIMCKGYTTMTDQGLGLPRLTGKAGKWWIRGFQLVRLMRNSSKSSSTELGPNVEKREAQDPYPRRDAVP